MRRRRAKVLNHQEEVDKFYKILTNRLSSRRGGELIMIMPSALKKIADRVVYLSAVDYRNRNNIHGWNAGAYLGHIYNDDKHFANFLAQDKPAHLLINYVRMAMVELRMWAVLQKKVTLRTIRTSGRLYHTARKCGLDLEYECERYGLEVLR